MDHYFFYCLNHTLQNDHFVWVRDHVPILKVIRQNFCKKTFFFARRQFSFQLLPLYVRKNHGVIFFIYFLFNCSTVNFGPVLGHYFHHTTKTSFEFFIQLKCSRFVIECWGEVCLQHSSLNCPKTWHKNLFDLLLNCNKVWQIILSFIEAVSITRILY